MSVREGQITVDLKHGGSAQYKAFWSIFVISSVLDFPIMIHFIFLID